MKKTCWHSVADNNRHAAFTAVVLAGDRGHRDPLVERSGACCKAMITVDGTPMVLRVLNALDAAQWVGARMLSGPAREQLGHNSEIDTLIHTAAIEWCEPRPTPSTSAFQAMQRIPDATPVLVTTADHPLLSATIIDEFCAQSTTRRVDVTVGLTPYALVKQGFPDMKKTVLRFRDGDYCGSNLFAFLTSRGRRMADYWRRVENQRKSPLKIIRLLGWGAVIRYLLGRLTLENALTTLSRRLDLRLDAVILPYAEAAVDIDSIADHDIVQKKLAHS
jgi:molybdopterin-guanine dinucleotide biosynthesis protein A